VPNQIRIKITSTDEDLLKEVVRENVELVLNDSLFVQECVELLPPEHELIDFTIDFPASSSGCASCGF
jgi:ribosomal protein S10